MAEAPEAMVIAYDCQTSGACCSSLCTGDGYGRLYEEDLERLRATGLPLIYQLQGDHEIIIPKLGTNLEWRDRRVCVGREGE